MKTDNLIWLIIKASYIMASVFSMVPDAAAQEPNSNFRKEMNGGVRIHFEGGVREVRAVSSSSKPASLAYSKNGAGNGKIICSIGDGVESISSVMANAGDDPGDCVIFFDPVGGGIERVAYHQPRPDFLVTSLDGRYVAMASIHGWCTEAAEIPELKNNDRGATSQLPLAEINKHLGSTAVGTLRYSVWEVSPVRPVWEMRFYGEGVAAGKAAKFERPWGRYAKMSIPWWAINGEVSLFRSCRIGFSPDSKYFVALDPAHGVHILNVEDGRQYHCCERKDDAAPIVFSFLDNASKLGVLCENRTYRVFELDGGLEEKNDRYRLPAGAKIKTSRDGGSYTQVNFSLEQRRSQFGVISDGRTLTLIGLENESQRAPARSISKIGREFGAGRLDYSSNGRYLGIGYGYQFDRWEVKYPTRMLMYEVADLERGLVIRRVARASDVEISSEGKDVPTKFVSGEFQACLAPDDRGEPVFVEALPMGAPQ